MAEEKVGWEQTKAIWSSPNNRFLYGILGGIVLIGVGIGIGRLLYADQDAWGYEINVFTSVISTIATVVIVDRLAERRADRKAEEALKRQLVDDVASTSNEIAKNAVHQLNRKGWLRFDNGLLKGANLGGANLRDANFYSANLQRVSLYKANLPGANLHGANLQSANLIGADFQNARLYGANLQDANLVAANLQDANLIGIDLRGADLRNSNFQNAKLLLIKIDEKTTLPDGIMWTPEGDMERFTDPSHPNFWHSPWGGIQMYRGYHEE